MKRTLILLLILLQSLFLFSQDFDSNSKDKSTVYFVRASGLGALINFTYFDGEKPIGRFNGPKYMKYECDPGKHLFWARSENKSFVEANLKAGGIYLIDVLPTMGGLKAGVILIPVDKNNHRLKAIQKLVTKRESESFDGLKLNDLQNKMSKVIVRGMKKYNRIKDKGGKVPQLTSEMTVNEEDLVFVKKKRKKKRMKMAAGKKS